MKAGWKAEQSPHYKYFNLQSWIYFRERFDPGLIGSKICFSDTNTNNSVWKGPHKALRAKRCVILHLSKKKLFTQVMVNRNSYEPQWCQRPEELQNKLVEGFCSAGARGRSRRDLPSSHTTAGHQTAERRQTQTAFGKLLSRSGQRA